MIDIYFYNINKRLNSTARPSGSGTKYECVLKDNTSVLSPVLRLRLSSKPDYNYFKMDNRYYWITDITSLANDLWQIAGQVDVLATFKGHIQATSAFVLYDSTPNTQLPDSRLAIETDCDTYTATASMPWYYTTGTSGTYMIATTGDKDTIDIDYNVTLKNKLVPTVQSASRNGTGVYAIPYSSIEEIGFDINDFITSLVYIIANEYTDIAQARSELANLITNPSPDILTDIVKAISTTANMITDITTEYPTRIALLIAQNLIAGGNALQNVKASYWLPFTVPGDALVTPGSNRLALGTYTDNVPGLQRVADPIIKAIGIDVNIPWHFNDWRDATCTEVMLYIPLIGCINIPSEVVKGNDKLTLGFALNLYSGELAVEVKCNGAQLGTYGTNCAMNILIGDSNVNMGGAVNTIVGAATHNYASVAGGITETLSGMSTSVGGIGGGAGTGLTNQIVCICRCHETSQNPSALLSTIGTPTRQLKTLSGSGYCQTQGAQMSGAAVTGEPYPTQTEYNEVNNYLDSGVYLE